MSNPTVYDENGSLRDFGWLQSIYGSKLFYHDPKGYPGFVLKVVSVRQGATNLYFTVWDVDGKPKSVQPVAYTFPNPGSPEESLKSTAGDKSQWTPRAVIEKCEMNGQHNFQIGSDSWMKDGYGPYSVMVISPSVYSGMLEGIGWLGGTDHRGPVEFLWQLVEKDPGGSVDPPPPDPDNPGCLLGVVTAIYKSLGGK